MIKRVHLGQGRADEILDLPNLIEIQLNSYEKFLQLDKLKSKNLYLMRALSLFLEIYFLLKVEMVMLLLSMKDII